MTPKEVDQEDTMLSNMYKGILLSRTNFTCSSESQQHHGRAHKHCSRQQSVPYYCAAKSKTRCDFPYIAFPAYCSCAASSACISCRTASPTYTSSAAEPSTRTSSLSRRSAASRSRCGCACDSGHISGSRGCSSWCYDGETSGVHNGGAVRNRTRGRVTIPAYTAAATEISCAAHVKPRRTSRLDDRARGQ